MSESLYWNELTEGFRLFLKLEKSLSINSIDAYLRDVNKLKNYCLDIVKTDLKPQQINLSHVEGFIHFINDLGVGATSQSRILSGIRAFFKYLLIEDIIDKDPTELIEMPKLSRRIPDVLSDLELGKMIESIDMSRKNAHRDKAIIEIMYGCGLRVSELCNLKISQVYFENEFIKVSGKGKKERLIPIGIPASKQLKIYIESERNENLSKPNYQDFVFLNNRGTNYTRVMIFYIIKKVCLNAGINKVISPHTLRHSFASHLVDGGADLRAVQEMLGHESILTTEIYTHVDNSYLRNAIIQFHPRGNI